jgi:MFS transporter, YQGE family, putative transporter
MYDFIFNSLHPFLRRALGVHRNLPERAQSLIWMIALYDFTFALSNVFINVFLFRGNDDWSVVINFNIVQFFFVMVSFVIGGYLANRHRYLLSYQLGFLFTAVLYLMVLLWREGSVNHPGLLGVLSGLGMGFYYLGQHALTLEMTDSKNRDYFFSVQLFLSSIVRVVAPALSGWIIAFFQWKQLQLSEAYASMGYYLVFGLTLAIYLALIYKSSRLQVSRRTESFQLWKVITHEGNREWNRLMGGYFILGLRSGVFWFVVLLLVYQISRNEGVVGVYNMLSNLLAVLTAYFCTRWARADNRGRGLWISSWLIFLAGILVSWRIDTFTLWVFAVLNSIGVTWFLIGFSSLSFEAIEKAVDSKKRNLEYLVIREIPLGAGRLAGLFFLLWCQGRFGETGLRAVIFLLGLTQITSMFFVPKPTKNIYAHTSGLEME